SHWFLPLDKYETFLRKWILEEHRDWKTNVYGQCKSWLDLGLQPRAVSRDLDWGVPVPIDGAKGKVLYVWFDAPIGYISATKELTNDWEKYWKDEDTRLIHFIGKDNIVFHCIMFPAMLKAEGSFILPENVPANEFLNLEGEKISTSRNWAVWLHEYLEDFPNKQDVLRYTLCANMPETKDNDFTWKDFQSRNNNELVAILGNFVNRAMVLTSKYFDGKVPAKGNVTIVETELNRAIINLKKNLEYSIENFRFREALKALIDIARLGNKYLADSEPWKIFKTEPEKVATILYYSLQIAGALTSLCEPFLPFTSKKLCKMLNLSPQKWDNIGEQEPLAEGHILGESFLLFAKIEDEEIQKQIEKLKKTKTMNEQGTLSVEPSKSEITFDDFSKMDIRIGTVLEAERVPKTQKLLKLKVDTGIDIRTLISGIAEYYTPESIIGKQVCILTNLQPRNIKGVESKGMILMACGPDGVLKLVSPSELSVNGSIVK
ncbi:MAG: methionine--tRNA ligase subunit beta, partial [Bacteroidetes bacterium CG02_land_8_20_14_3_00_31_25]